MLLQSHSQTRLRPSQLGPTASIKDLVQYAP
uniref:Uncharacterized protein n=1 Tax=Anguilla anguilla TaxID=7936 RepID=A0A0E9UEF7_ANGAN